MFDLLGSNMATCTIGCDPDDPGTPLGTDQPLRHNGTLYQGSNGASVTATNAVKIDTALLEAMAPIVNLVTGASLTTVSDAISLTQKAKLSANIPNDALVKLNASTLTVQSGSLLSVANSFAKILGSLFSLNNNSTLSILAGAVATVSGSGSLSITNSIGIFGASGVNTLNITNNSGSGTINTSILPGGYPVLLKNGALPTQITLGTGFTTFSGSGTPHVNISGPQGAVLVVDGTSAKVKLGN
jgi:hypothetical protein